MNALIIATVASSSILTDSEQPEVQQVAGVTQERDDFVPDETPIDKETYNWQGSGNEPKYLTMPSISTEGFIEKVGIRPNNEIDVPSNTNLTGWYTGSAKPGDDGLAVIDGHLNGLAAPGVFRNLHLLVEGDKFTLETGEGDVLEYEVLEVRIESTANALNYLFSQKPDVQSQLNLITCGGEFDDNLRRYEERVIVSAQLLN